MNNFEKRIVDLSAKYDDETPFKKPKLTATDKYKLYKSVANQQEKKEFRDIERKYQKNKLTAQRTEPFLKKSDTTAPLNIDITPLPQMNPFANEKIKEFYTAGTKPKVSEGLAKILGVDND